MNTKNIILILAASLLAVGCSREPTPEPKPLPEVNDKNCADQEMIRALGEGTMQEFSSQCLRRGSFKPSPKKSW